MPNRGTVGNQAFAGSAGRAAPLGSIIRRLFARRPADPLQMAAGRLHDTLIARIRTPDFYTDLHVPDTFEGRFDLLVLHVAVALRGLARHGADGQALTQALVDTLFARFDIAMRELGVSDIGVPKRMKRLAQAFKGRTTVYHDALARQDGEALAAAIERNVLSGKADGAALARDAMHLDAAFTATSLDDLIQGRVVLPQLVDGSR